jgi:hypothetical protein
MRTDRELLELAAKAAGITVNRAKTRERDEAGYGHCGLWTTTTTNWNPLTEDGDALRLAVKLRLHVIFTPDNYATAQSRCGVLRDEKLGWNIDDASATRRAIVRSAAEIGAQVAAQQNGESDG